MENTLNKQNFFAQHWGQRVWRRIHTNGEKVLLYVNANTLYHKDGNIGDDYLELKPISSITDEHLHYVAELFGYTEFYKSNMQNAYYRAKQIIESINYHPDSHCDVKKYYQLLDYFRSKGFAIDWMGLSVEQLQEYGWIKLKSE